MSMKELSLILPTALIKTCGKVFKKAQNESYKTKMKTDRQQIASRDLHVAHKKN